MLVKHLDEPRRPSFGDPSPTPSACAVEARASANHTTIGDIIREALHRFLDVAEIPEVASVRMTSQLPLARGTHRARRSEAGARKCLGIAAIEAARRSVPSDCRHVRLDLEHAETKWRVFPSTFGSRDLPDPEWAAGDSAPVNMRSLLAFSERVQIAAWVPVRDNLDQSAVVGATNDFGLYAGDDPAEAIRAAPRPL